MCNYATQVSNPDPAVTDIPLPGNVPPYMIGIPRLVAVCKRPVKTACRVGLSASEHSRYLI